MLKLEKSQRSQNFIETKKLSNTINICDEKETVRLLNSKAATIEN